MKRALSLILALAMLLGLLPQTTFLVYAEDGGSPVNALEGKTIACIGDSITAGVGVTKDENDYVTLLAEQLGMDYIRLGASGTTLCTDGSRTCNIGKLTESNLAGADVVTIAMGINDFCAAAEDYYALGDIDSADSSTIYGAARMWCERIAELRKTDSLRDTKFYFLTPVICSWNNSVTNTRDWNQSKTNIHGYTLRDLCNAIIEVAVLYDVAVIDLNLLSGMYYVDAQDNNTAVFGGDGVHPGAKGHEMMAAAIANVLLQNNLRNDHVHTFGSWITTTWPSCVAGKQQRVCTICSATEGRTLESGDSHRYSAVVTAPTCTEQGYTTHTCTLCGDSYVDSKVEAKGHKWTAATCEKAKTCTACGKTEGTALGHNWIDATCEKVKTCSVCGMTDGNALGHNWQEATCAKPKTCRVCGKVEGAAKDHSWDDGAVTKPATEEAEGVMTYKCTSCGETKTASIPVLSHTHKYEKTVTAPTCTEQGYTTYTCKCGHSYVDNYVSATGHKTVADKAVEATCTKTGLTAGSHCSVCGTVITKQETVSAKGHTWDQGTVIKPATEETEGVITYKCTACGETKTESIPVLVHTHKYLPVVTAATCTESGYTTYTCGCADSYTDDFVAALGHEWLGATCQRPKTCNRCGITEGSFLDHSFGAWQILSYPSCTAVGQKLSACACGEQKMEEIPMLMHEYKNGKCQVCGATNEDFLLGDVNGDGKLTYMDALSVLRASIGLETLDEAALAVADVNGDGKLTYADALSILRASIGLETLG